MELSERKKKVLRSVVDLYIRTAEPVGSKAITELPDMKYSSATIRNEMAELTTLGYLEQPHTSAGRIPSAAGYRLYVDELMADYRLSIDETKSINSAIEEKMQQVDKMVEKVARLVSQATDLPAISVASRQSGATVKRFDLILAGQNSVILVIMLSTDEVVNKLIKLPVNVTETDTKLLSAVLNAAMTGLDADGFTAELMEKVMTAAGAAAALVPVIVDFTADTLRRHSDGRLWLHTADLGHMDADGFVYFHQRLKRMIVTSGYNVYPSQLENVLDSHDKVLLSCVIGVKDPYRIQRVKAYVVPMPGIAPSDALKEEILAYCAQRIAKYAMPRELEFRQELPKTLVGKVAYRTLEEEANAREDTP